jgi:hypothetical protein
VLYDKLVAGREEKRQLLPCQILHTVLVHLEIAATKITMFRNMAFKTAT